MKSKYLVVYFQPKGEVSKCATVANAIENHLTANGNKPEVFAITPVEEYPADESLFMEATKNEVEKRSRPEIEGKISDGLYHDIKEIILVAPNWWNSVPMAVLSFFDQHDNNYKRLIPVILHGGDGASEIERQLRKFLPETDIMKPVELTNDDLKGDIAPYINKVMKELDS